MSAVDIAAYAARNVQRWGLFMAARYCANRNIEPEEFIAALKAEHAAAKRKAERDRLRAAFLAYMPHVELAEILKQRRRALTPPEDTQ